jgi:hypothetical protein
MICDQLISLNSGAPNGRAEIGNKTAVKKIGYTLSFTNTPKKKTAKTSAVLSLGLVYKTCELDF